MKWDGIKVFLINILCYKCENWAIRANDIFYSYTLFSFKRIEIDLKE